MGKSPHYDINTLYCERGCHPVILTEDGTPIASGKAHNELEMLRLLMLWFVATNMTWVRFKELAPPTMRAIEKHKVRFVYDNAERVVVAVEVAGRFVVTREVIR